MKLINKLAMVAAGIAVSFGVFQTEAKAASFNQIVDINANNSNPVSFTLSAGTYSVDYIGTSDGGAYDGWNAWNGSTAGTDGWMNRYTISTTDFTQEYTSGSRYGTSLQALQNAVDSTFTLTSDTLVNFSVRDTNYADNVGGVSLQLSQLSATSVPEPASILGLLTVGSIAVSSLKRKKEEV